MTSPLTRHLRLIADGIEDRHKAGDVRFAADLLDREHAQRSAAKAALIERGFTSPDGTYAQGPTDKIVEVVLASSTPAASDKQILDEIGKALESRGFVNMTNGRDIGLLLDELDQLKEDSRSPADRGNYEDRHPNDMVLHPLTEIREWDEALQELGIEDSDATPAEAVRALKDELAQAVSLVEELRACLPRLVDWTHLYALEGASWPDRKTISEPLIRLATSREPTQDDAEQFKLGTSLFRFSPPHPSTNRNDGGGLAASVPAQMQGSNDRGSAQDAERPEDTTQGDRPARSVTCSPSHSSPVREGGQ